MANCYECLHYEACSDIGEAGFSYLKDGEEKCDHFKNKDDFVKVKRGEWVWDEESAKWGFPFICTAKGCGKAHNHKEKYCPNCGAIMDGGKK